MSGCVPSKATVNCVQKKITIWSSVCEMSSLVGKTFTGRIFHLKKDEEDEEEEERNEEANVAFIV